MIMGIFFAVASVFVIGIVAVDAAGFLGGCLGNVYNVGNANSEWVVTE